MLNKIENAVVSLLTGKLESARKLGVQKGVQGLSQPAVYASVEAGTFEKVTGSTYKQFVTLYVDIIFASLKDQQARREGINLILEGAIQLLLLNRLGLEIHPLMPKLWRNTTTAELDELGLISYSLELSTFFHITKLPEEDIGDLFTIAVDYFLQDPLDGTIVDAADVITTVE